MIERRASVILQIKPFTKELGWRRGYGQLARNFANEILYRKDNWKADRSVVVSESSRNPREQVYLIFTDDTHFELFGDHFSCGTHTDRGGVEHVLELMKHYGREKVRVYPEIEGDVSPLTPTPTETE